MGARPGLNGAAAYTHIIVGAGSAGCTLAGRLTEDADARVLLLEAGGWDRDPLLHIPLCWPYNFLRARHDWGYFTEPEPAMGGRPIEFARGKVIGGSSQTNAMAYVRGHPADFDRWAATYALPDWSYAHVLPYFRRQESWEGGADRFRGGDGPLTTRNCAYPDPIGDASSPRAPRRGTRSRTTTTARSPRASAAGRPRCATGAGAARRSPICARRWRAKDG